MKTFNKPPLHLALDAASVFLAGFWLISPWSTFSPQLIQPVLMPLSFLGSGAPALSRAPLFAIWLIALWMLFLLAAAAIPQKLRAFGDTTGLPQHIMRILATAIIAWASILPILVQADTPAWFSGVSAFRWTGPVLAAAAHIASTAYFLSYINWQNPVYREYREFRKQQKAQEAGRKSKELSVRTRAAVPAQDEAAEAAGKKSAVEIFFRIRSKLFLAFIGIFSLILVSLTTLLLGNYKETILDAVGDTARSFAEQAASSYRINLGDEIALHEFINRQNDLNKKAEFKFHDLTLYTNLKQEIYLDDIPAEFPEYRAEYGTLVPGERFPETAALSGSEAKRIASDRAQGRKVSAYFDPVEARHVFETPIIKIDTVRKGDEKIRRERFLGAARISFDDAVIMRPYFKTRISVVASTAFFLYLAIILTYVVGNYIVNPLLFLRMNVRKISEVLTDMIRGETRVSANAIVYRDCVTSRDEIKSLSTEINDMVTVIRGIVPYISASTLKHAESGSTVSTEKDLAFLFTDIRGFTTLCEGMKPEQVVDVLNRYLDLETEIILNNQGDVDKFVGDEMMAFFDGPNKDLNACRAAMQIRHAMMEEKEKREKEGLPVVAIGIGINSGPVVFGSVGARERMDFTSIGDTVNLAARLEGANKAYGSKTLITETVWKQVREDFLCREMDVIAVKGKNEPVRIYEILQESAKAPEKLKNICAQFEEGIEAYRKRSWKKAEKIFGKLAKEYGDEPSKVYLDRIAHFQIQPPADDWDGVFRMTVK
ncbi:adenylate/guanylate cyclase domain-containing protein [Treponema zuelzerae]|uniref:Adenylate/guanylate cyclase domain-containing protein n=1 Tax=Teretinema zuelzerae TaxID=156 RepID=A0AAE3EIQ4_9SPIR|nr:adenylate/guanylate cyclase domain-containing protein [Teretinema zuelzerae]MCD1654244.1 adenylate/guanylate cyclase domain-containing protein [Teretinema zuelzerae]